MQLLVSESADFAGRAFPDDGGFSFARGLDVAVEAVVGEIDLAADEPLGPWAIPFENFVPLLEPMQFAGDAAPELVGIVDGFLVETLVFGEDLDVSLPGEFGGGLRAALFLMDGIDG